MGTLEFKAFSEHFLNKPVLDRGRERFNVRSLHVLSDQEKMQAEEIFLEKLAKNEEDENTIIVLRELKSKRAVPLLKAKLPNPVFETNIEQWPLGRANIILESCLTLWKIEGSFIAMDWIIRILLRTPHQAEKIKAAYCLRYFPCRQAENALLKYLNDENELIRLHAATSLLVMHGIWEDEFSYPQLARQVASRIHQVRMPAIQIMQKLMENSPLPSLWMKQ